jgi:hypothetical protein
VSSTIRSRSVALAAPLRYSYIAYIMLTTYSTVKRYNRKSCKNCCFIVILLPCYIKKNYVIKVKAENFLLACSNSK